MKRPSRIHVSCVLIYSLGFLFATETAERTEICAQEPTSKPETDDQFFKALLTIERLERADDENELLTLRKAQHNAALDEVQASYEELRQGNTTIHELFDAGRRLLGSQLELATSADQRIAVLETALTFTRRFEAKLKAQLENGYGSKRELARIKYERLKLQIQLAREKQQRRVPGRG